MLGFRFTFNQPHQKRYWIDGSLDWFWAACEKQGYVVGRLAGGFTPRAFRRDLVVSRTADGVATRMTVPLNFPLRPGDTVSVQERWF